MLNLFFIINENEKYYTTLFLLAQSTFFVEIILILHAFLKIYINRKNSLLFKYKKYRKDSFGQNLSKIVCYLCLKFVKKYRKDSSIIFLL